MLAGNTHILSNSCKYHTMLECDAAFHDIENALIPFAWTCLRLIRNHDCLCCHNFNHGIRNVLSTMGQYFLLIDFVLRSNTFSHRDPLKKTRYRSSLPHRPLWFPFWLIKGEVHCHDVLWWRFSLHKKWLIKQIKLSLVALSLLFVGI